MSYNYISNAIIEITQSLPDSKYKVDAVCTLKQLRANLSMLHANYCNQYNPRNDLAQAHGAKSWPTRDDTVAILTSHFLDHTIDEIGPCRVIMGNGDKPVLAVAGKPANWISVSALDPKYILGYSNAVSNYV